MTRPIRPLTARLVCQKHGLEAAGTATATAEAAGAAGGCGRVAARASELPIGRQSQDRGRHQIESSLSGFGVLVPKIFFACGALLGRLRRAATAPAAGSRPLADAHMVSLPVGVRVPTHCKVDTLCVRLPEGGAVGFRYVGEGLFARLPRVSSNSRARPWRSGRGAPLGAPFRGRICSPF